MDQPQEANTFVSSYTQDHAFSKAEIEDLILTKRQVGIFTFKNELSELYFKQILELAYQLQFSNTIIWHIKHSNQDFWYKIQNFITKVECKYLDFSQDFQNVQQNRKKLQYLMKLPKYIESKEFPNLTSLSLSGMDISSFELLSNLDSPQLEYITIQDSPYVQLKSFHKTNFRLLHQIHIDTMVISSAEYLNRMRIKDYMFCLRLTIANEHSLREERTELLNYDLRFTAKFYPKAFVFTIFQYGIGIIVALRARQRQGIVTNEQKTQFDRETSYFKNYIENIQNKLQYKLK